jgi:hypothetical protein
LREKEEVIFFRSGEYGDFGTTEKPFLVKTSFKEMAV